MQTSKPILTIICEGGIQLRKIKFLSCLVLVVTLIGIVPADVHAVQLPPDADIEAMYTALRTSGLTGESASALMGNIWGESYYDPKMLEGKNKNGIGMFQWTDNVMKEAAQKHFQGEEHKDHEKYTFENTVCGDLTGTRSYTLCAKRGCQMAYGVNFAKDKLDVKSKWASNYNDVVKELPILQEAITNNEIPKSITPAYPFDSWSKSTNIESATVQAYLDIFSASATRPFWIFSDGSKSPEYSTADIHTNVFVMECKKRIKEAKRVHDMCKDKYEAGESLGEDSELKEELAVAFKAEWSDEQLESYCRLTETNMDEVLESAKRENLSATNQHSLAEWEANVESNDNWLVWGIRHLCIFIGICMIVWAVAMYVFYWFDRLNVFGDFSLVAICSLNKLNLSETERECTYFSFQKQAVRTVNNRAMLVVCLLAVICGTFITTGTLYKVMLWTVLMAQRFLNR